MRSLAGAARGCTACPASGTVAGPPPAVWCAEGRPGPRSPLGRASPRGSVRASRTWEAGRVSAAGLLPGRKLSQALTAARSCRPSWHTPRAHTRGGALPRCVVGSSGLPVCSRTCRVTPCAPAVGQGQQEVSGGGACGAGWRPGEGKPGAWAWVSSRGRTEPCGCNSQTADVDEAGGKEELTDRLTGGARGWVSRLGSAPSWAWGALPGR